jgi:hypothetical protein
MKNRTFTVLLCLSPLILCGSVMAHHSASAIFDMTKVVTLKGIVTKLDWVNPHIVVYMDAKTDDGKVDNWKFESEPPKWFSQVGVTRADIAEAIGQTVKVEFLKAKDGSKYGFLRKIAFPNGNSIAFQVAGEKLEEDGQAPRP